VRIILANFPRRNQLNVFEPILTVGCSECLKGWPALEIPYQWDPPRPTLEANPVRPLGAIKHISKPHKKVSFCRFFTDFHRKLKFQPYSPISAPTKFTHEKLKSKEIFFFTKEVLVVAHAGMLSEMLFV